MSVKNDLLDLFVSNLVTESRMYYEQYGKLRIDSIFFGGGTPNVLTQHHFNQIVSALHNYFNILPQLEFTVEMNPGVHSKNKLNYFKQLGVNRVSVGVQSFSQDVLNDYERNHSDTDSNTFINDIFNVDFKNVSVDIIFGHPKHQTKDLTVSLDRIQSLPLSHVALYGLTIEKGTPFHEMAVTVNDDHQYEHYIYIQDFLTSIGYEQYEVSNFSRPEYRCQHNIKYWTLQSTIGLGAGAHSFFLGHRYNNDLDIQNYLSNLPGKLPHSNIPLDWNDFISVRLRYCTPIYFSDLTSIFNFNVFKHFEKALHKMNHNGFINLTDESFVVTKKGFPVLDELICYLLN